MGEEPVTTTTTSAVAAADDAFGADLYRLLTEDATETVFSPVSVATALGMALCGARGQTAAELAGALHEAPDAAAVGLHATSAVVRDAAADGSVTLRAPGIVWVQSGLPLLAGFTSQLGERRHAGRLRRGTRGGAGRDQPGHRRDDRGKDHRAAAGWRDQRTDPAGAH